VKTQIQFAGMRMRFGMRLQIAFELKLRKPPLV
jgi:hypothetical protein